MLNAEAVTAGRLPPERLGVSAPNARTVVFQLTRSAALEQLLLLPVAYPVYLPAVARFGAQHTRPGHLVSNGAYMLQSWSPQSAVRLVRNPQFHDATPIATSAGPVRLSRDSRW